MACLDQRRPGAAGEIRRARGVERRLQAMRAPGAELHHRPPLRRDDHARRLAGDGRLEIDDCEERGLDELRYTNRRGDAEDRLVRKDRHSVTY